MNYCNPELLSIWVKAPILNGSTIVIMAKCLKWVNPELYKEFSEKGIVLENCPEQEGALSYGKIASIIRSSNPKKIIVVTIDGSPHCFALQAAVNEAVYLLGEEVDKEHYVVVNGEKVVKINPETIRVARYLSLVDILIKSNPNILKELYNLSKEQQQSINLKGKSKLRISMISKTSGRQVNKGGIINGFTSKRKK